MSKNKFLKFRSETLRRLLMFLTLVALLPTVLSAYDFEIEGIYYYKNSDGKSVSVTYKDTDYNSYSETVSIPPSVEDSGVTYSVTSIGDYAFYGCSGLTSVSIPNSVTSIGSYAFEGCGNIETLNIDSDQCASISFFPSSKTKVKTLVLGNSITSLGTHAFDGCSGLTSITIPASVTFYGRNVFENCSGLTSVEWNAKHCVNPEYSFAYAPFKDLTGIKTFTFGNEVEIIPANLCLGLSGLTSVTIPNSVTRIDHGAFAACSGLTSVSIGNSVKTIGYYAFRDCSGLTSIEIPNSVTTIVGYAFQGCRGLTSVTIPNSVTAIEGGAFWDCSGLTSIEIPNSVTWIGNRAFHNCALTSVTIPNSVTAIEGPAFTFCSQLTSIVVEPGNSTYDSRGNCNAIVKTSNNELVEGCKNTVIPNSVTSIGGGAFFGCSGLTSIEIPNSVTSIGTLAFYKCIGLTSIEIPNSVTEIGECAFQFCFRLKSVTNMAETPQSIRYVDFGDVDISKCKLFVWHESIDKYKSANVWKDFIIQDLGGVDGVEADTSAKEVEGYYDTKGVRHDESIRGQVNIVRYTDGTTQKVVVK